MKSASVSLWLCLIGVLPAAGLVAGPVRPAQVTPRNRGAHSTDLAVAAETERSRGPQPTALLFDRSEIPGQYYFGDGLAVNCTLLIQANGHFLFRWRGCLGEYDNNHGSWRLDGDTLLLTPERPNKREGFRGMSVRLIPVKWGSKVLLVDENEMPGFCASAAERLPSTGGVRRGIDYVKVGQATVPSSATLLIPDRYREFYERGPITATITRINPDGSVVLTSGGKNRLKIGMLMAISAYERINLEVITVSDEEAVARPFYFWNSDRAVKVGDVFTTGTYRHRPRGTGYQRFSAPPVARKSDPRPKESRPPGRR